MPIRINKVTKEFSIGLQTLVDLLNKKGFTDVEANPNASLSDEQYAVVQAEFNKEQSKGLRIPTPQPAARKTKEKKEDVAYSIVYNIMEKLVHLLHLAVRPGELLVGHRPARTP